MSEFTTGFIDAYRDDLTGMLDIGEELALIHTPGVVVSGIPSQQATRTMVQGDLLQGHDTEIPESNLRKEEFIGLSTLIYLDGYATTQLCFTVLEREIPRDTPLTAGQKARVGQVTTNARDLIDGGYHTYAKYGFRNAATGEDIVVTNARIVDGADSLLARELEIVVSDEYVAKTFTIRELPTSFDGQTILTVGQTLAPVRNDTLVEAAAFLEESGTPEDMSVITGFFYSEYTGTENTEVAGLLAKHEGTGQAERLKTVLDNIRSRAAEARENNKLASSNPETALPSATELYEYQALLSRMRA